MNGGFPRLVWARPLPRLCACLLASAVLGACGGSGSETTLTDANSPTVADRVDEGASTVTEPPARTLEATTTAAGTPNISGTTAAPAPVTTTSSLSEQPAAREATFSLTGEDPTSFPDDWAFGFVSLRSTFSEIVEFLGPPARVGDPGDPDSSFWGLPGGATLTVTTVSGLPEALIQVSLEIPEGSPVRVALDEGVVFGSATIADLTSAWGEPILCADIGKGDCDVLYNRCVGGPDLTVPVLVTATADPARTSDGQHLTRMMLAENQSPQARESCAALALSSDGLGIADLGESEAKAVTSLLMVLGPTPVDEVLEWPSDEPPAGIHNGYPTNYRLRTMTWMHSGLSVVFSDGVEWPDGRAGSVLTSWSCHRGADTSSLTLSTDTGIVVGSPVADAMAAYGDALKVSAPDEFFGWQAALPSSHPGARPVIAGLTFWFSDDPSQPGSVIEAMAAGAGQAP